MLELVVIAVSSLSGALSVTLLYRSKTITNSIDRIKGKTILHTFESARSELESLKLERDSLADKINRIYEAKNKGKIDTFERDRLLLNCKEQIRLQNIRIKELEEVSNYSDIVALRSELVGLLEAKVAEIDNKVRELSTKLIVNTASSLEPSMPYVGRFHDKENENLIDKTQKAIDRQKDDLTGVQSYNEENIHILQREITQALTELEESNTHRQEITENFQIPDKKRTLGKAQKKDALSSFDHY